MRTALHTLLSTTALALALSAPATAQPSKTKRKTISDGERAAATWAVPGCMKSASVGETTPSGQRSTEKIVPTEMFTSMLEEPSSGSKSSRKPPRG